jgi:hypothetical protein
MFNYMRTKNGNIIAVVDKKKSHKYQKRSSVPLLSKKEVCLRKSLKKSVGEGK